MDCITESQKTTDAEGNVATFAACVFEPGDIVEIRTLKPDNKPRSTWTTAAWLVDRVEAFATANDAGANVYVGANPRKAEGGTKAADVDCCRTVFVDFDGGVDADEASRRISVAGLPVPTMTVFSGHGVHCYWRTVEPMQPDEWQPLQAGLIAAVDSDRSIKDPPRIMRLPGFLNRKPNKPPVRSYIVDADPARRYPVDDLAAIIARHTPPAPSRAALPITFTGRNHAVDKIERARKYLLKCPPAVSGQGGHSATFRAACVLVLDFDLSPENAFPILSEWNQTCQPPWTAGELWHKLYDADKQEGERGNKLNSSFERRVFDDDEMPDEEFLNGGALPQVVLPGGAFPVTLAARQLGGLLGQTGKFFNRGGSVVRLDADPRGEPVLRPINAVQVSSEFEQIAKLVKPKAAPQGGYTLIPAICTESTARLIVNAQPFVASLPRITLVSSCPVLVDDGGQLRVVNGYDPSTGILAHGPSVPEVSRGEAIKFVQTILGDFQFATEGDRARAMAAIITPALVMGGLLGGRAPIDLGEADDSQTGKGYRNKLTAAIYRCCPSTVTQTSGGVGGLKESFDAALVAGRVFVCIDNVRGKIDLAALESFCTEKTYSARIPYQPPIEIDPTRTLLMMTSNRAEMTTDLANRSSIVRMLKRGDDYKFARYPEGDVLDHVQANQPFALACVFRLIREWHERGKPRSPDAKHDFRAWATTLDWIVSELLGGDPLMAGHREVQKRTANPALNWIRDVALAVKRNGRCGEWLRAHDLIDLLDGSGVEVPGLRPGESLDDNAVRERVLPVLGRHLSKAFQSAHTITVDAMRIERREGLDENHRKTKEYAFFS